MKRLLAAISLAVAAPVSLGADPAARDRLQRHFGGWYSFRPESQVSVRETDEISIRGFEAYRVTRRIGSKPSQESDLALYDRERDEVFVGRVIHKAARAASRRPFDALVDAPEIEAEISEAHGLPATLTVKGTRGALHEVSFAIRQLSEGWLSAPGYVSEDGASILLGEFQSLQEGPEAFRRRLLSERPGVRPPGGTFRVTEFIDFQCERCRKRAPEVEKFAAENGGSIEVRFFPLVKIHPWAFAAAESGAALAALSSDLYKTYETALFGRAAAMHADAARQLAADVAEAAGRRKEFSSELSSGRARDRVLADLRLGMRLGVTGTPFFVHEGTLVSGEPGLLETLVRERLGGSPKAASR